MAKVYGLSEADRAKLKQLIDESLNARLNNLKPMQDLEPEPAIGGYVASGSIPARSGTTSGTATCLIHRVTVDGEIVSTGKSEKVYNVSTSAATGYFPIGRDKFGKWFSMTACCWLFCCNLQIVAGNSDVGACNCHTNVPLYRPMQLVFEHLAYRIDANGVGLDEQGSKSIEWAENNNAIGVPDTVPPGYGTFRPWMEPADVFRWNLSFKTPKDNLTEITIDSKDTLIVTSVGDELVATYREPNLYSHESFPSGESSAVGYFRSNIAWIHPDSRAIGSNPPGENKTYKYVSSLENFGRPSVIYPGGYPVSSYTPSPNQAFYEAFNMFEAHIRINEVDTFSLPIPQATIPVNPPNPEGSIGNLYKFLGEGGCGSYAIGSSTSPSECWKVIQCQRKADATTGTGGEGTAQGDTVSILGFSPDGSRSRCWTTVVVGGELYTCEWMATYDDEDQEDMDAEVPIVQDSITMYRASDAFYSGDEYNKQPLLSGAAQVSGVTPNVVPQSRWRAVRAWSGGNNTGTGTLNIGTGTDSEFVLPNGVDWRETCLTITPTATVGLLEYADRFTISDLCSVGGFSIVLNRDNQRLYTQLTPMPEGCDCIRENFGLEYDWMCLSPADITVSITLSGIPIAGLDGTYVLPYNPGSFDLGFGKSVPWSHALFNSNLALYVYLAESYMCASNLGFWGYFHQDDPPPGECAGHWFGGAPVGVFPEEDYYTSFGESQTPPQWFGVFHVSGNLGAACESDITIEITLSV